MKGAVPARPSRRRDRRSWRDEEFAALDFETTGLDPKRDHIVSFGVVPITSGRIAVGDHIYRQVSPPKRPTPTSVTIHGLRQADLDASPGIDLTRDLLGASLEHRYIVAWAAEIEAAFLAQAFGGSVRSWRRRIIDAMVLARSLDGLPHSQALSTHSLSAAAEMLGVPVHSPHDALDDALTTAQVFLVLATRSSQNRSRDVRWLLQAG